MKFSVISVACLLFGGAAMAQSSALVFNGDPANLAFQPSFATHPDGARTYVWNAYRQSRERIFAATFRQGRLTQPRQLSPGAGVYYQPVMVATGPGSGWVFWTRQVGLRWQLVGRQLMDGGWKPVVALTGESGIALAPSAIAMGERVAVAWEDHTATPQRIKLRIWNGREWGDAHYVSPAGSPCYRPALAATRDAGLWVFWDSYDGREYAVYGKSPSGAVERLSPAGRDCLKATAAAVSEGLAVAWVSRIEVIGGEGVLDHWDRLQVATRGDGKWRPAADVADLRQGLLSTMEPVPGPIWGYAGRRRHPILAADGDAVWLLWERKAIHDGRSDTTGQLCGRRFDGESWSDQVVLHEGLVDYRVASNPRAEDGRLAAVGKDIHHYYWGFDIDLNAGRNFAGGEWPGWKPVTLPLRQDEPRPSIEIDGRRHYLYWGDLHVHSELTPDAEGEVDELMYFARDKARIDVVVMQENDANSWMNNNPQGAFRDHLLTQSEYALSIYFSRKYTENGRFVALPGFEWSQRTDDDKPNHRTVIYAGADTPLVRHPENDNDFGELCDIVEAAGGLMNTQHGDYRLVDRSCDANIEVAAGWGVYINNPAKIHADLTAGYKVGFVATSDGHRRNPGTGGGLTGIYAPELTPEAILKALGEHRVYATNGSRIFIDARANGVFMGRDLASSGEVELTLELAAPKPIVRATLIRDGAGIHVVNGAGRRRLRAEFTDQPGPGFHWYYWRIEQEGISPDYPANMKVAEGHLGWSSPHRVTIRR